MKQAKILLCTTIISALLSTSAFAADPADKQVDDKVRGYAKELAQQCQEVLKELRKATREGDANCRSMRVPRGTQLPTNNGDFFARGATYSGLGTITNNVSILVSAVKANVTTIPGAECVKALKITKPKCTTTITLGQFSATGSSKIAISAYTLGRVDNITVIPGKLKTGQKVTSGGTTTGGTTTGGTTTGGTTTGTTTTGGTPPGGTTTGGDASGTPAAGASKARRNHNANR